MGLKLLHLSDIHFKTHSTHGYFDLDKDIQTELEIDLAKIKNVYKKIDIILIGGDIAFSGKEDEYATADTWIKKICKIVDCEEENVLTVPGNHDVDRSKLSPVLRDIHSQFKKLRRRTDIDRKIEEYVKNIDSAQILLSPLNTYHSFAQKYGSIPKDDNILFWEKEFSLDSSVLKIRGVNSAFVSNDLDDEHDSKLFLGSVQSTFSRQSGVINLLLCHHPPQWLYDGDEVKTDLRARVRINLFGHKHKFDSEVINNKCLILSAGAMQPSRSESGWEPRYNILDLSISSSGANSTLCVKVYRRIWDKQDLAFKADFAEDGAIYAEYKLDLSADEMVAREASEQTANLDATMTEPIIDLSSPDPRRKLAYMFLGLPYHVKLQIAVDLKLIEDADKNLSEIEKSTVYFRRATEKKLLFKLWERVAHATGISGNNPFKL